MEKAIILGTYGAAHLGDAICATPLVRQFRQEKNIEVWITRHQSTLLALENNPFLAGFHESKGVALGGMLSGSGHIIQRLQRGAGVSVSPIPRPELFLSDEERKWALQEKASWPNKKPFCVLSCRVLTDAPHYINVDWQSIGELLGQHFTIVQPIITKSRFYLTDAASPSDQATADNWKTEPIIPSAVVYQNLSTRQYLALFSVVDAYCGGPSGGSHAAAAYDLPAVTVIWRSLKSKMQFPAPGKPKTTDPEHFLYPYHHFICAEDVSFARVKKALVSQTMQNVARECRDLPYRQRRYKIFALANETERRPRRVPFRSKRRIIFLTHE